MIFYQISCSDGWDGCGIGNLLLLFCHFFSLGSQNLCRLVILYAFSLLLMFSTYLHLNLSRYEFHILASFSSFTLLSLMKILIFHGRRNGSKQIGRIFYRLRNWSVIFFLGFPLSFWSYFLLQEKRWFFSFPKLFRRSQSLPISNLKTVSYREILPYG